MEHESIRGAKKKRQQIQMSKKERNKKKNLIKSDIPRLSHFLIYLMLFKKESRGKIMRLFFAPSVAGCCLNAQKNFLHFVVGNGSRKRENERERERE